MPHVQSPHVFWNRTMLALHKWKILLILVAANLLLLTCLSTGDIKAWRELNWLDILGEGGVSLLSLVWLLLILHSRPAGRVTNFFVLGLAGIFLASFQDALDEVIQIPDSVSFDQWVESGLMPVGLLLLTYGIYHWHKEQLQINEHLRKRERLFREHRIQDPVTHLGSAEYLRRQLRMELAHHHQQQQPLSLLLLDIDNFAYINRRYGSDEGDRLLQELAELILLNLRRCDLLCRYAGDRFAIVLPNTGETMAQMIAQELANAVRHFAFKTSRQGESVFHSVSIGVALALDDSAEHLLTRANQALLHAKEKQERDIFLAA
jgi:diguanylate cyclase (GGDEF)-like protein